MKVFQLVRLSWEKYAFFVKLRADDMMQWIVFKWSHMKCSFLSADNFLLMSLTGGCLAFEISLWSFFKLLMFLSSFPVFMCTFHIQENFIFPCVFPISMWISCFHEHIPFSGIIPVSMSVSCFHVYFLTTVRSPPRKIRLLVWICQNKLFPLRARFLSSFVSN